MAKYGMVIDLRKCTGCYNCFLTCRDEFAGNEYPGYSAAQPMSGQNWIRVIEKERGQYPKVKVAYTPVLCSHCEEASCVKAAPDGAIYRRADGIVIIDPVKARGQKELVSSCPYRMMEWNEELQVPQKCTLCAHLLDKGEKEPRCVEACPTGALVFGDLEDAESEVSRLMALPVTEVIHPEYGLGERIKYINLPRKFIAGTVIYGDMDECADNLTIHLCGEDGEKECKTNGFGDFEFEGLPGSKEYTVTIKASDYKTQVFTVKTLKDVYLGRLTLQK